MKWERSRLLRLTAAILIKTWTYWAVMWRARLASYQKSWLLLQESWLEKIASLAQYAGQARAFELSLQKIAWINLYLMRHADFFRAANWQPFNRSETDLLQLPTAASRITFENSWLSVQRNSLPHYDEVVGLFVFSCFFLSSTGL